uniref:Uncharacterized protein n=1 Tax=Oryza sativa subsp. japonica TaxID=39947 RepID=Q6ZL30_ORYSJ|nr:hypothetical protein [Oryza sativa Japonica Group]BAD31870.1 hypothetical protein [Oryza sativa Japonica Group]
MDLPSLSAVTVAVRLCTDVTTTEMERAKEELRDAPTADHRSTVAIVHPPISIASSL